MTQGDGTIIKGPMSEALLTLIKDLSFIVSNNWHDTPSEEIKCKITAAVGNALRIAI